MSLFAVCGRANYTNLSRYSPLSERTFRRNFNEGIALEPINQVLIEQHGSVEGVQLLAVDTTFHEKGGRCTPDLDWFYNGKTQQVEKGLEWSVLAVTDLQQRTAYALSAQQTDGTIAAQVKADTAAGKPGRTRVDFYLGHLAYCQPSIPKRVKYVVSDSFYSKRKWVDGVITLGWNAIGKLRQDANLNYLHQGKRRPGPARPQKYDGKVNPMDRNPAHFTLAATLSDETQLWTAVVWSVSWEAGFDWSVPCERWQGKTTMPCYFQRISTSVQKMS